MAKQPAKKEEKKYPMRSLEGVTEENYKIAYAFASDVYKEFANIIKAIILFGSTAKGTAKRESDIDILIVVDDASMVWDLEAIAWYRQELAKLVLANPQKHQLHINTLTLTSMWENLRTGDPAVLNMLRYGIPLLDTGFIDPLKFLLFTGRIKPTPEAVYTALGRAPWHLKRARIKKLQSIGDIYWSMVDSAHAALMIKGWTPPSPEHIGKMLTRAFAKNKLLAKKYVDWYYEIYQLSHDIKNNVIADIHASEIDKHLRRAKEFIETMNKIVKKEERA